MGSKVWKTASEDFEFDKVDDEEKNFVKSENHGESSKSKEIGKNEVESEEEEEEESDDSDEDDEIDDRPPEEIEADERMFAASFSGGMPVECELGGIKEECPENENGEGSFEAAGPLENLRRYLESRRNVENEGKGKGSKKRIKTEPGEKTPVKCQNCDFTTPHRYNLKRHLERACPGVYREPKEKKCRPSYAKRDIPVEERPCCHICGHSSASRKALKVHMLTHDENNRLKCDKCDFKTFQKNRLKTHIRVNHEGIPYSCEECSFTSFKEVEMKFHKRSVHKGEIYQCEFCPYRTVYPEVIKRHRQAKHTTSTDDLLKCSEPGCDYRAKTDMAIRYHMKAVHLQEEKPSCDQCGKTCANMMTLKHHIKYVHATEKLFMCDKCDYATNRQKQLQIHNAVKHEGFLFSCEEPGCTYQAGQPGSLKDHVNEIHLKKVLYCSTEGCGFTTLRRQAMDRHRRSVHEGITYDCPHCDYRAKRQDNLKNHMKVHTMEQTGYRPPKPETEPYYRSWATPSSQPPPSTQPTPTNQPTPPPPSQRSISPHPDMQQFNAMRNLSYLSHLTQPNPNPI